MFDVEGCGSFVVYTILLYVIFEISVFTLILELFTELSIIFEQISPEILVTDR